MPCVIEKELLSGSENFHSDFIVSIALRSTPQLSIKNKAKQIYLSHILAPVSLLKKCIHSKVKRIVINLLLFVVWIHQRVVRKKLENVKRSWESSENLDIHFSLLHFPSPIFSIKILHALVVLRIFFPPNENFKSQLKENMLKED